MTYDVDENASVALQPSTPPNTLPSLGDQQTFPWRRLYVHRVLSVLWQAWIQGQPAHTLHGRISAFPGFTVPRLLTPAIL